MGLFFWKGIEDNAFRPRDDGDWDFFPNGALGGGYRVNAEQRERIASALRGFYGLATVLIIAGIALGAFGGGSFRILLPVLAVLLAAMLGYWLILLRPLWRGLPRAERRLGFGEAQTQVARTVPKWRIVYVLVVGPLFGLLSLFLLWIGRNDGETSMVIVGVVGLVFAGALTWAGIVMWRKRRAFERRGV
jgi:hypothetical protein